MSAKSWLPHFTTALAEGNADDIASLFAQGGFWRDYLPFRGTLQTIEGREEITTFGARMGPPAGMRDVVFEGKAEASEGFFRFAVASRTGRGYLRLSDGVCETLFTQLDDLAETRSGQSDPDAPFVLVVGGGQGGLALGAQLSDLGVPYLIIDKHPRVGDQWRSRYDSLVLHDPVWYDHLPFKPFPEGWPVFTPKDQMGDWLEAYAEDLELDIWTNTALTSARFDETSKTWTAQVDQDGASVTLQPTHIVMALGLSGFPNVPEFSGQDAFSGP